MIRKQRLHTLPSRLLITRCTKSNRRGSTIDQEDADAQNRANIAKQQAANARAQVDQDNEQIRQQQKAVEEANRHQEALEWAHRHRRHR